MQAAVGIFAAVTFACPAASGQPIEDRLSRILTDAAPGVVGIEVRRAFSGPLTTVADRGAPRPTIQVRGNGIVWDREGHILTVTDLAQPGDTIVVIGSDGRREVADFVNQDAEVGLSLIRIDPTASLRPIPPGASAGLSAKDWVFLLSESGIPHSNGRLTLARVRMRTGEERTARLRLEGDVDPGLAGGGVLDGEGRLVGMLLGEGSESLLLGPGPGGRPMEFCLGSSGPTEAGWILPIEHFAAAFASLIETKGQGFLGVRVDLAAEERPTGAAPAEPGVLVSKVLPGSPAARAGILPGDRLIGLGGLRVASWDELTQKVAETPPHRPVQIQLVREGRERTVQVRLEDRGSIIWREKQRALAGGRERILRRHLDALRHQLELLRYQQAVRP